jgi:glyoxylase I family protein
MNPPGPGIHHLAIQVQDLARCESFYRDLLGLPVLRRWPRDGGGGDRSVWLDLGAGSFLALEVVGAGDTSPDQHDDRPGLHLLALRIAGEQRAFWVDRLTSAGFPIYRRTPYTIYVRDPEGNRIGLSHWPDPEPHASHHL